MIKKTLSFCLSIGLILSTTKGSEMTEATTENLPESSLTRFIEKSKETQANIIEHNLLSYVGRYNKLTERTGKIDQMSQLFKAHLRQDQRPREGYDIILEDIRAHPDPTERARQLLQMEELIALINSGNLPGETLNHLKAKLDQRKQRDLSVRIGVILQRIVESQKFKEMNAELLAQIKTVFENDLEKLRHYRNEETISKWTLESPLVASVAATAEPDVETPLPILADVVRNYISLTQAIKDEEIDYLRTNIALLSGNRDQLAVILEEAKPLEETSARDEMIQTLKKDLAEISDFIAREQARLTKLTA